MKFTKDYYRVEEGGSMYKNCKTKDEAFEEALKVSVGRSQETLVYHIVCHTDTDYVYDTGLERYNEVIKSKTTTETLALKVIPRKSLSSQGGWTDYEG